ncbi:hypothetical protein CBR_g12012 [Chara braunii]|uniref:WW domain-containing protein n=1 Tax=Chara braunii TaxID=69332 RepID=A0A388KQU8_CHABU|nr:hypothetical protein CBR_g12012 [Chara braunii]|eukprot:GBG72434.1 hypothetical protein CBR_g12012 [Chara braunii]
MGRRRNRHQSSGFGAGSGRRVKLDLWSQEDVRREDTSAAASAASARNEEVVDGVSWAVDAGDPPEVGVQPRSSHEIDGCRSSEQAVLANPLALLGQYSDDGESEEEEEDGYGKAPLAGAVPVSTAMEDVRPLSATSAGEQYERSPEKDAATNQVDDKVLKFLAELESSGLLKDDDDDDRVGWRAEEHTKSGSMQGEGKENGKACVLQTHVPLDARGAEQHGGASLRSNEAEGIPMNTECGRGGDGLGDGGSPAGAAWGEEDVADGDELESGWRAALDKATGLYYYWNTETGETTWERPSKKKKRKKKKKKRAAEMESVREEAIKEETIREEAMREEAMREETIREETITEENTGQVTMREVVKEESRMGESIRDAGEAVARDTDAQAIEEEEGEDASKMSEEAEGVMSGADAVESKGDQTADAGVEKVDAEDDGLGVLQGNGKEEVVSAGTPENTSENKPRNAEMVEATHYEEGKTDVDIAANVSTPGDVDAVVAEEEEVMEMLETVENEVDRGAKVGAEVEMDTELAEEAMEEAVGEAGGREEIEPLHEEMKPTDQDGIVAEQEGHAEQAREKDVADTGMGAIVESDGNTESEQIETNWGDDVAGKWPLLAAWGSLLLERLQKLAGSALEKLPLCVRLALEAEVRMGDCDVFAKSDAGVEFGRMFQAHHERRLQELERALVEEEAKAAREQELRAQEDIERKREARADEHEERKEKPKRNERHPMVLTEQRNAIASNAVEEREAGVDQLGGDEEARVDLAVPDDERRADQDHTDAEAKAEQGDIERKEREERFCQEREIRQARSPKESEDGAVRAASKQERVESVADELHPQEVRAVEEPEDKQAGMGAHRDGRDTVPLGAQEREEESQHKAHQDLRDTIPFEVKEPGGKSQHKACESPEDGRGLACLKEVSSREAEAVQEHRRDDREEGEISSSSDEGAAEQVPREQLEVDDNMDVTGDEEHSAAHAIGWAGLAASEGDRWKSERGCTVSGAGVDAGVQFPLGWQTFEHPEPPRSPHPLCIPPPPPSEDNWVPPPPPEHDFDATPEVPPFPPPVPMEDDDSGLDVIPEPPPDPPADSPLGSPVPAPPESPEHMMISAPPADAVAPMLPPVEIAPCTPLFPIVNPVVDHLLPSVHVPTAQLIPGAPAVLQQMLPHSPMVGHLMTSSELAAHHLVPGSIIVPDHLNAVAAVGSALTDDLSLMPEQGVSGSALTGEHASAGLLVMPEHLVGGCTLTAEHPLPGAPTTFRHLSPAPGLTLNSEQLLAGATAHELFESYPTPVLMQVLPETLPTVDGPMPALHVPSRSQADVASLSTLMPEHAHIPTIAVDPLGLPTAVEYHHGIPSPVTVPEEATGTPPASAGSSEVPVGPDNLVSIAVPVDTQAVLGQISTPEPLVTYGVLPSEHGQAPDQTYTTEATIGGAELLDHTSSASDHLFPVSTVEQEGPGLSTVPDNGVGGVADDAPSNLGLAHEPADAVPASLADNGFVGQVPEYSEYVTDWSRPEHEEQRHSDSLQQLEVTLASTPPATREDNVDNVSAAVGATEAKVKDFVFCAPATGRSALRVTTSTSVGVQTAPAVASSGLTVSVGKPKKSDKVKSKKRSHATILGSGASYANKKVSSLLSKWQAAKEEMMQREDEVSDEERALYDPDALERKREKEIEEWRRQQLASGEALENSNFQPLGGVLDWRERVKRARKAAEEEAEPAQNVPTEDNSTEEDGTQAIEETKQQPDLTALSQGLPEGWEAYWDGASQEVYYGNIVTRETSWERPC